MSVWERLNNLNDAELRILVESAVHILLESQGEEVLFSDDLPMISTLAAARQIAPVLREANPAIEARSVQFAIENEQLSREICLAILGEISKQAELAESIEEVYNETRQKLSSPELILMAGALLVLAIKLKEVRVVTTGKSKKMVKEVVIKFTPASNVLKEVIARLINVAQGS